MKKVLLLILLFCSVVVCQSQAVTNGSRQMQKEVRQLKKESENGCRIFRTLFCTITLRIYRR